LPCATHGSVCLEPPPDRKLPALLAVFRVSIEREAFASVTGFPAGAFWEAAAFVAGFLPVAAVAFNPGPEIAGGGRVSFFCVAAAVGFGKCLFRRAHPFV
jgi:hypothetical protein